MQCELGGNFSAPDWPDPPGCVNTCSNFPKFVGANAIKFPFNPVSTDQVLANREREFVCKNQARIPLFTRTQENITKPFNIRCKSDGKFEVL